MATGGFGSPVVSPTVYGPCSCATPSSERSSSQKVSAAVVNLSSYSCDSIDVGAFDGTNSGVSSVSAAVSDPE